MLSLVSLGLCDGNDITLRGLGLVRHAAAVYIEGYTSLLRCSHEELEAQLGRPITKLSREDIEQRINPLLERARAEEIVILVIGDVFGATTHADLFLRATQLHVPVTVVHNASVLNAVGVVGLELYKYGRTVSIPYWGPGFEPTSYLEGISKNLERGLHTLCLLDIKAEEPRFMSVQEGLRQLLTAEAREHHGIIQEDMLVVGVARIGYPDARIVPGPLSEVMKIDFGAPPHCIIIPGKLHPVEEEMLAFWRAKK
jgi:diphthine synthase